MKTFYDWCIENNREDLLKEWHPTKNGDLNPKNVSYGCRIKAWWKCVKGHEWFTSPNNRKKHNCPYCCNQKILKGYNDLATTNPELLKEWNYEKNVDISPYEISSGTNRKVWWKCEKGHEWQAGVVNRKNGQGCPFCSNKKVLRGYNDLATTHSNLVSEWNFEKNKDLTPYNVVAGSNKKVWWKCKRGHEWQAAIIDRALYKQNCSKCGKIKKYSFPEKAILFYLKGIFDDVVENYKIPNTRNLEIDIFIKKILLGIEYDGRLYHKNIEKDIRKDSICAQNNISLIRIREKGTQNLKSTSICFEINPEKNIDLEKAIYFISEYISTNYEKRLNIDVNVNRDAMKIYELMNMQESENSLGVLYPEISKEWHPTKNGNITPFMIYANSNKPVWWKCKNGHEWQVSPNQRIYYNSTCPYCNNNKVLKGYNDLATTHPHLLKEWDFEKNEDISPYEIIAGSSKRVWWKCEKGHEWQAIIQMRALENQKCPYCCNQKILKGYNDLATTNPELIKEWDFEKNKYISPYEIGAGTSKKVWWKCEKGHEWQASVVNRKNGTGCPYCSGKKILSGYNDFATKNPELMKEWDYNKNKVNPSIIAESYKERIWWKCSKCGYEWQAKIISRIRGAKCPHCKSIERR